MKKKIKSFDNAITAYYKPDEPSIIVQLFIDSKVARYFIRKPLNTTQRIIKKYDDKSIEVELSITDYMEIIPTIQRYMPYVMVIEPDELKLKVKENIEMYIKNSE